MRKFVKAVAIISATGAAAYAAKKSGVCVKFCKCKQLAMCDRLAHWVCGKKQNDDFDDMDSSDAWDDCDCDCECDGECSCQKEEEKPEKEKAEDKLPDAPQFAGMHTEEKKPETVAEVKKDAAGEKAEQPVEEVEF